MNVLSMGRAGFRTLVLATLFAGACQSGQVPAPDQIWPAESWQVSTPLEEGIDPEAIDSLLADMDSGVYGLVDHFLLIRNGKIVADRRFSQDYETIAAQYDTTDHPYNYDHPAWHPYLRDTELHTLQSVTKSITSAALGVAIDEGLIEDVDVHVAQYLADYPQDLTDPRRDSVTLADLLTMRSGIQWNTSGPYGSGEHSTDVLESSDTWIQYILDQPMDTLPGSVFEYNDGASVLLGKILREATGQRADEWARERLFEPIGIRDFFWKITPDGEADTEGGLYLSSHDLARIGYLFLRGGEWNGTQIVSSEWVESSTSPVVPDVAPNNDRPDSGYGYQWWVPDHEDGRPIVFAGNGYGGQFLLVAPDYDIVAVFNGWNIHGGDVRSTWRALQDRILPAVTR
jgi:CubicO group peptidase (beta-lactamase class C family)